MRSEAPLSDREHWEYDAIPRRRGSLTVRITKDATVAWRAEPPGTPGGEVEKVAFAYQKITWTSLPDNHVAMDDAH